jgi:hypothetical protein
MCTQYLHHVHPPIPFPQLLLPSTSTSLPRQDMFHLPVLWFCKRKKNNFFVCLR